MRVAGGGDRVVLLATMEFSKETVWCLIRAGGSSTGTVANAGVLVKSRGSEIVGCGGTLFCGGAAFLAENIPKRPNPHPGVFGSFAGVLGLLGGVPSDMVGTNQPKCALVAAEDAAARSFFPADVRYMS